MNNTLFNAELTKYLQKKEDFSYLEERSHMALDNLMSECRTTISMIDCEQHDLSQDGKRHSPEYLTLIELKRSIDSFRNDLETVKFMKVD